MTGMMIHPPQQKINLNMNSSTQNKNISRWASWLMLPYLAVAISFPYLSLEWLLPVSFLDRALWLDDIWVHPQAVIAFETRLVFFLVWCLPLATGLYAFWAGGALLLLLRRGIVFDPRVARKLWQLGMGLVLNVGATMVAGAVSPMIRAWHDPEGPLALRFWYTTELGGLLICGLAFLMITAIQRASNQIAKETEGFI